MKIKITRNVGGHKAGTELELPDGQANHLVAVGYAEKVKARAKAEPKGGGDSPSPRRRVTAG